VLPDIAAQRLREPVVLTPDGQLLGRAKDGGGPRTCRNLGKSISVGSSIRRVSAAVLAATLLIGLVGTAAVAAPTAPAVSEVGEQDREALQQAMGELAASGAVGVQVRVHDQQGDWTGKRTAPRRLRIRN